MNLCACGILYPECNSGFISLRGIPTVKRKTLTEDRGFNTDVFYLEQNKNLLDGVQRQPLTYVYVPVCQKWAYAFIINDLWQFNFIYFLFSVHSICVCVFVIFVYWCILFSNLPFCCFFLSLLKKNVINWANQWPFFLIQESLQGSLKYLKSLRSHLKTSAS